MTTRRKDKPRTGWIFDRAVHAGGRIMCVPIFRSESHALQIAARFGPKPPKVLRATLTLLPPKGKAGK